ncbi:MAG: VWA domain-containing protein [Chloracidobacterium sp.]|uniref:VWA domain-containing protein n=1 Tax=Chloracidobacterium validum TaxID=2821543 RepID=A0ABX8BB03_9BACT|nr:VWA domain-containing protein [Chloracidobacterium validum]QUW03841.1 VWA domain-containing protein [Chloracidobacterium validum]
MRSVTSRILAILATVFLEIGLVPTWAQDSPIRLTSELVVFEVSVFNRNTNAPVDGLSAADFTIIEDGKPQTIAQFGKEEKPLSVMVVLDTSKTTHKQFEALRQRLLEATFYLRPSDEMGILVTAERTELICNFTYDRRELSKAIRELDERKYGEEGIFLHDAIARAALALKVAANPAGRRVIVVISDNVAQQSRHLDRLDAEDAQTLLSEVGATVCGLILPNPGARLREAWRRGLANPTLSPGDLNDYAAQTGGETVRTTDADAGNRLGETLNRLRARYTVAWVSSNPNRDGKFRKVVIRVGSSLESYVVKTRRGYFAPRE